MNTKLSWVLLMGVTGVLFLPGIAEAQFATTILDRITSRPSVSPYLQLARTDSAGLSRYHTNVKPRLQARNTFREQETTISQLRQQISRVQNTQRSVQSRGFATGHPTRFMNFLQYYPQR